MDNNKKSNSAKSKKKNATQLEGYNPKVYTVMKLVYTLLSVLNIIVVIASFGRIGFALNDARIATECIGTMNTKVVSSSTDLFSIVLDLTNDDFDYNQKLSRVRANQADLWATFEEVDKIKEEFDGIKRLDSTAKEKVDVAWDSITRYRDKLREFDEILNSSDSAVVERFVNDIHHKFEVISPLMEEATTQMEEAAKIQRETSYSMFVSTAQSVLWIIIMLVLIYVIGIVSIVFMQRSAKNTAFELKKKNAEIEAFSKKLFTSRDKTKANSHTNPLTGLKNRHAMEEDIAVRLETEDFYIANFNFDHLRDFNENFGRDFGDEYLITVANRLKADFSKYAEIYNLTFDEFCFVFNSNITDDQAESIIKNITKTMSAMYTIFNISVQLNVSGCVCSYHAKDYLNLNSLFIKLDRTLHQAKDEGGNTILPVQI